MKLLCQKAMEILMEESNVQRVEAPVTVSRDVLSDTPIASKRKTLCAHQSLSLHDCLVTTDLW